MPTGQSQADKHIMLGLIVIIHMFAFGCTSDKNVPRSVLESKYVPSSVLDRDRLGERGKLMGRKGKSTLNSNWTGTDLKTTKVSFIKYHR